MSRVDLTLTVDVERTPRVRQVEGMFDVPEAKRRVVDFHFDVPLEDQDWQIGLIVGPSGAGKTSVARHLFGEHIVGGYDWHGTRSIVDSFGDLPIRAVTAALSSVGFSSPPSWVKPFHVLSNGEGFRATLARALVDPRELIVMDEFTSVVDRTTAQIGSHAVAKAVRRQEGKRFVAVSCHDDILEWLQPDWVLEPHIGRFHWRSVQRRPGIDLEIVRVHHSAWAWFAMHHYLSAKLNRSSRCFCALIGGRPAAFCAIQHFPHPRVRNLQALHRTVVLPNFQGIGLGSVAFVDKVAGVAKATGHRVRGRTAHPALTYSRARSNVWRMRDKPKFANRPGKRGERSLSKSSAYSRRVAHFEYVGPAHEDKEQARTLWGTRNGAST